MFISDSAFQFVYPSSFSDSVPSGSLGFGALSDGFYVKDSAGVSSRVLCKKDISGTDGNVQFKSSAGELLSHPNFYFHYNNDILYANHHICTDLQASSQVVISSIASLKGTYITPGQLLIEDTNQSKAYSGFHKISSSSTTGNFNLDIRYDKTTANILQGEVIPGSGIVKTKIGSTSWAFQYTEIEFYAGPYVAMTVSGHEFGTSLISVFSVLTTNYQIQSTVMMGQAPISVSSATLCTNLNADLLDGYHASAFQGILVNPVTGTGNIGYIPKFTGTSSLGDSVMQEYNGMIGIGGAPATDLHIKGANTTLSIEGSNEALLQFKGVDTYANINTYTAGTLRFGVSTTNHNSGATQLVITPTMVGIGVVPVTYTLAFGNDANKTIGVEPTAAGTAGRQITLWAGSTVAGGTDIAGGNLFLRSGYGTGASNTGRIVFVTGTPTTSGTTLQGGTARMAIWSNGNIGIGITQTSPGYMLHVAGTVGIGGTTSGIQLSHTPSGGHPYGYIYPTLKTFMAATHPEDSGFVIPYQSNDIAYNNLRGGSITTNQGTEWSSAVLNSLVNGAPDYAYYLNTATVTWPIIITVNLFRTFAWNYKVGFASGTPGNTCSSVKIEQWRDDTSVWEIVYETTTNTESNAWIHVYNSSTPTPGYTVSKFRYTLANPITNVDSGFRIAQLWALSYSSNLAKEVMLGRDGGTLYGTLTGTTANFTKLNVTNLTSLSATAGVTVTTRQIQANASDTGDASMNLGHTLQLSSGTNALIQRVFGLVFTNNMTGGGTLSNARVFNLIGYANAGTTTSVFAGMYIENGASPGTVTSGYAIYIGSWVGTNKWGLYDNSGGMWYMNGKLGMGVTTPTTARLQFVAGTTAADGILFGTDVTLYRSAADVLKTDDALVVGTTLTVGGTAYVLPSTAGNPGEVLAMPGSGNAMVWASSSSGGTSRWTAITGFTRTPASTSTITVTGDITGTVKVGMPIKFASGGTYFYALITTMSFSTNTTITFSGAPATATTNWIDADTLFVGTPEMVTMETFQVAGAYATSAISNVLENYLNLRYVWRKAEACLVHFSVVHTVDATTTQPKVNVKRAGTDPISTSNSNTGVEVSATTWSPTTVDIHTSNYVIRTSDTIELSVTADAGLVKASDLTIQMMFVNK